MNTPPQNRIIRNPPPIRRPNFYIYETPPRQLRSSPRISAKKRRLINSPDSPMRFRRLDWRFSTKSLKSKKKSKKLKKK